MSKTNTVAVPKWTLALVIGLAVGFFVGNGVDVGSIGSAQAQVPTEQQAGSQRVQVSTDDDPSMGDADAPVTIIEFGDFECPFCRRFWSDTLPQIKSEYIDTGKVKLVYRDYPLTAIHPKAAPAAEAAECANEQGKFWEFHDEIFENQASMSDSYYKQVAAELGLNTAQFNSCVDSRKYRQEVEADIVDGSAAGVSGTPTIFIGNEKDGYIKVVGAQPYVTIKGVIEQELE